MMNIFYLDLDDLSIFFSASKNDLFLKYFIRVMFRKIQTLVSNSFVLVLFIQTLCTIINIIEQAKIEQVTTNF